MDVAAGETAVLIGAQGPAVVITHPGGVAVAAVVQAVVKVAAGGGTAVIGADGDGGLDGLGSLAVSAVVAAASAVTAVGGGGDNEQGGQSRAERAGEKTALPLEHGNDFLSVRSFRAGDIPIVAQGGPVFKFIILSLWLLRDILQQLADGTA